MFAPDLEHPAPGPATDADDEANGSAAGATDEPDGGPRGVTGGWTSHRRCLTVRFRAEFRVVPSGRGVSRKRRSAEFRIGPSKPRGVAVRGASLLNFEANGRRSAARCPLAPL